MASALALAMAVSASALGCGGGGGGELPPSCEDALEPGPSPIRRLTRTEYNNTVYQLFGDNSRPADSFPADEEALGFDNQATSLSVSPLLAEKHRDTAELLAARHAPGQVGAVAACATDPEAASCAGQIAAWIADIGLRVFRRPLTSAEVEAHAALFHQGTALGEGSYDLGAGVELVLDAMLQSPHFLYRVELGAPDAASGDVVELTSYEMASRLSYLFWGTMPDVALFEAAAADQLRDPAAIEAQARRMLAAPRAREAVKNFHRQWLGLDEVSGIAARGKDLEIYPDYDEAVLPMLQRETEEFLDHAIFEESASVETLFTASWTMMNAEVAAFYGIEGPVGEDFERVELDPTRYAGFLSHAGVLAAHAKPDRSSPVHRGLFVRERVLCQIPPAPPDVVPEPPTVDTTQTTREQYAQHEEDPLCAGCHRLMDAIGFGFEHFDGMGRYRENEWGLPIDASGELVETEDADGPFDGVVELGARLAGSQQVRECVTRQWFRYGYGRVETAADTCSMDIINQAFAAADYDVKELLVALTQTPAFRYRRKP